MINEREFKSICEAVTYAIEGQIKHLCQEHSETAMIRVFTRHETVTRSLREMIAEEVGSVVREELKRYKVSLTADAS